MEPILRIEGLTKHYGKFTALHDASFTVEAGSVCGILGPNGSGKTTTLGIVLDVLTASAGTYSWFGNEPSKDDRKRIGAILEHPNFYPYLSAIQNLKIVAKIKGASYDRIEEVLKMVNLWEVKDKSFKAYSLGMKQRLAIAGAMVNDPDVLVLDEPTNGLDPQGIAEMRNLINHIANSGKTILIASHLLDEVEKVCTHVTMLKNGRVLVNGPVKEVMSDEAQIIMASSDLAKLQSAVGGHPQVKNVRSENGVIVANVDNLSTEQMNGWLQSQGIVLSHLTMQKQSLESFFLEVTNTP